MHAFEFVWKFWFKCLIKIPSEHLILFSSVQIWVSFSKIFVVSIAEKIKSYKLPKMFTLYNKISGPNDIEILHLSSNQMF